VCVLGGCVCVGVDIEITCIVMMMCVVMMRCVMMMCVGMVMCVGWMWDDVVGGSMCGSKWMKRIEMMSRMIDDNCQSVSKTH